jgi:hypothetical protein
MPRLVLAIAILGGLALAYPTLVPADTTDLQDLQFRRTTVRVLDEEIDPVTCTPPVVGVSCGASSALFDPETIDVNCLATRRGRCTYELTLCVAYELFGGEPVGAVVFTVDGESTAPGPFGAQMLPRQPLGADSRTCVTVFDSGNTRGPHTIGVRVAVDNNLGGSATLNVRSATLVIHVYGE